MTPKEKAKTLVDKYRTFIVMWSGGIYVERENIKQCALICIEQMIKECDGYYKGIKYWKEVKKEINKL